MLRYIAVREPVSAGPVQGGVPDSTHRKHWEDRPTRARAAGAEGPERGSGGGPETAGARLHDPRQWWRDVCRHWDPRLPAISHASDPRVYYRRVPSNTKVTLCYVFMFITFTVIIIWLSNFLVLRYSVFLQGWWRWRPANATTAWWAASQCPTPSTTPTSSPRDGSSPSTTPSSCTRRPPTSSCSTNPRGTRSKQERWELIKEKTL